MASMYSIEENIVDFFVTFALTLVVVIVGGIALMARFHKQEAKSKKATEYQPSMILVDTVGAIILREYEKVYVERDRSPYSRTVSVSLSHDTYYFIYDNVRVAIRVFDKGNHISSCEFSVGNRKNIELTATEKKKLYNYLKEAMDIKGAKIQAEKEKQRQLEACDALENLLKPETPMLEKDNSTPVIINTASTNTTTSYVVFNNS